MLFHLCSLEVASTNTPFIANNFSVSNDIPMVEGIFVATRVSTTMETSAIIETSSTIGNSTINDSAKETPFAIETSFAITNPTINDSAAKGTLATMETSSAIENSTINDSVAIGTLVALENSSIVLFSITIGDSVTLEMLTSNTTVAHKMFQLLTFLPPSLAPTPPQVFSDTNASTCTFSIMSVSPLLRIEFSILSSSTFTDSILVATHSSTTTKGTSIAHGSADLADLLACLRDENRWVYVFYQDFAIAGLEHAYVGDTSYMIPKPLVP